MTNKEQSKDQTKRKHFRIKPIGFIRSDQMLVWWRQSMGPR